MEIFKTIPKARLGNKKLMDGNLGLLAGFEFNRHTSLTKLLLQLPIVSLAPSGLLAIALPKIELENLLKNVRQG